MKKKDAISLMLRSLQMAIDQGLLLSAPSSSTAGWKGQVLQRARAFFNISNRKRRLRGWPISSDLIFPNIQFCIIHMDYFISPFRGCKYGRKECCALHSSSQEQSIPRHPVSYHAMRSAFWHNARSIASSKVGDSIKKDNKQKKCR